MPHGYERLAVLTVAVAVSGCRYNKQALVVVDVMDVQVQW